jgi:hypothetical protein
MGNASCGVKNEYNSLFGNPANLGHTRTNVFSSLVNMRGLQIRDGNAGSLHMAWFPTQFGLTIPTGTIGSAAFAFQRTHDVTVKFRQSIPYFRTYQSIDSISAGISQNGGARVWSAGYGLSHTRYSVGLAYKRLSFTKDSTHIKNAFTSPFDGEHGTWQRTVKDSTNIEGTFNGIDFGAMVDILPSLTVGANVTVYTETEAHLHRMYYKASDTLASTRTNATISLPPQGGIGLSYRRTPHLTAAADIRITAWNRAETAGLLPAATREYATALHAGVDYTPSPEVLSPAYWQIMHYRGGFAISQLPRSGHVSQYISLGVGMPLRVLGSVDVSCEIGRRIAEEYSLNERFVTLSVGINTSQTWHSTGND